MLGRTKREGNYIHWDEGREAKKKSEKENGSSWVSP